MGREKFGEGHYYCGGVANATINEALKPFYSFFRSFACRPAAFCAVWGGRPKGEPPLANFKLHVTRVRVCVSLAALVGVRCGIGGQPVLEVGVVCANIDQRLFLVKPYISGFFLLGKPCYHASFLRRCYAIVAFFVCFLRILTWENGDFQTGARRTTPSSYDALLLAIFVFLRLYTVVAHSSMSHILQRGISRFLDCSGFSGSVWSMNCMNSLTLWALV